MWWARVGDHVHGRDNGWFRRALVSGTGHVHATYDRPGPAIISAGTGARAVGETLRLRPATS